MYSSIIEFQLQPGKMDEAMEITEGMKADLSHIDGLQQFIMVDKGNDSCLALAIYASQAQQEAASYKARELLGRLAWICSAAPERKGGEVMVNDTY